MADLLKMSADLIDGRTDMQASGPINLIKDHCNRPRANYFVI